jgi:hypothetical protein
MMKKQFFKTKIMIIVNYWQDADYDSTTDGYSLHVAGIINDTINLDIDPQLLHDAIDNDDNFEPKDETLYEIQLIRATIASDPIPELAFSVDRIIEKKYDEDFGWITPLIRM